MIAGAPNHDPGVPARVAFLAGGHPLRVVWENELGGLTFEVLDPDGRRFVKWSPRPPGPDLAREAARLRWAAAFTPVPRVLAAGSDAGESWLVTEGLPGDNAVSDRWKAEPATAVAAIGEGLRLLHERLPVDACPFGWSAEDRVAVANRLAADGAQDPSRWHPSHRHLDVGSALALVADPPPVDRLVVCHGDACAPNTLLTADGRFSGHVDMGALGVADRWADLAVATWSTEWNFGPGWEGHLLDAYGIDPDPDRTAYYRLLWDLGP